MSPKILNNPKTAVSFDKKRHHNKGIFVSSGGKRIVRPAVVRTSGSAKLYRLKTDYNTLEWTK